MSNMKQEQEGVSEGLTLAWVRFTIRDTWCGFRGPRANTGRKASRVTSTDEATWGKMKQRMWYPPDHVTPVLQIRLPLIIPGWVAYYNENWCSFRDTDKNAIFVLQRRKFPLSWVSISTVKTEGHHSSAPRQCLVETQRGKSSVILIHLSCFLLKFEDVSIAKLKSLLLKGK